MTIQKLQDYKIFKNEEILTLEPLRNQGFCNISYELKTSKNTYVLREFSSDKSVNISRGFEYKIQNKAYKKGIASKPIYLDKNKTFMIYNFLKGNHKRNLKKENLKVLIKTIKKLHNIKIKSKQLNLKNELKKYQHLKTKEAKNSLKICKKELKNLEKYKKRLVICHHDLNPKNILFIKKDIKFIDWEYAGLNDAFFDLATISVEFNLEKREKRYLLKKYLKTFTKNDILKLESYINIYKHICKLWFISLSSKNEDSK
ncbi:choline kinase family protein [Arcobacter arenosus]|uniref:Choline kinase n=1 Tax=Arcobacter arenosus TaxID=2576037 RepID=A0A5R8Y020_9BACT|nr:choline kinase family protein [Arcobacter arenosus]TLP37601.1 choline kinase [Arcobacter arenosus]